ncbi:leucine-rich repeat-containing protein 56 isoform X7 [Tupaia chinensis]|uniref:leucine-rich repeat-containing protein 56 isoform X7 n=1 Tax=Tupaia chinensis TaxID=246437 RepID=UPI0003C9126A|nr:leucine-rich repeat-containing protein 56 isoform X7 [Tupaia chinensis]
MLMDPAWDRSHRPRPGTASIQVRELSWQGLQNPCPQSKGLGNRGDSHREQLAEEYLSPARLQALAQVDDLRLVRVLEMSVDTRESSLRNFGVHLPNLSQLKLNGSRLGSLRDLGTSLGRLQVLWLARCGQADLDGISSFPVLKELYVSYNNIADLSPLCLLEQLEVLDLEGNSVDDLGQVRYLQLCPRLATLTLEGNLVCLRPAPGPSNKVPVDYNYRAEITPMETQSCPCLRPSPGPPGPGPSPCYPGAPRLKACFRMTWPQRTTPATSPMVLARSSVGTPSKAYASVDTSARPGHPQSSYLSTSQNTWPPAPPPRNPTRAAVTIWPWLGFRPGGSPACELPRTTGCHLTPSPPKHPPDWGSSSPWGSADLPFRRRRLRALGSLGSDLGQGLAAVTTLRALEVTSSPSPRVQGRLDPKAAREAVARSPGLRCLQHLAPSHPSPFPPLA